MAQVVNVTVIDDLDGETPGASTVPFSFNGQAYEIDLCPANVEKMIAAFGQFSEHARKVGRSPGSKSRAAASTGRTNGSASGNGSGSGSLHDRPKAPDRDWLRKRGFMISDKGRIGREATKTWERHLAGEVIPEVNGNGTAPAAKFSAGDEATETGAPAKGTAAKSAATPRTTAAKNTAARPRASRAKGTSAKS